MNRLLGFFFQPVAALRPLLFSRLFLLLLVFDLWFDFIPDSGNYGAAGLDAAHFRWLDAIQPVPSPALHVGVLALASFALVLGAAGSMNRLLLAFGGLLYTYGWAMSRNDSYQHHYLLSLVLLCIVFFPRVSATQVRQDPRAVIANAWAYALLAAQLAIVYLWTAVAKLDDAWLRGDTLRRTLLGEPGQTPTAVDSALLRLFSQPGVSPAISIGTVVLEGLLVIGYLFAVGQDQRTSKASRLACGLFWALAVNLHATIMLMPLKIGLFSLYMLLAACVFLLPLNVLKRISSGFVLALSLFDAVLAALLERTRSRAYCAVEAIFVAFLLALLGLAIDLPGLGPAMIAAAATLILFVSWEAFAGRLVAARRATLATIAFAGWVALACFGFNAPFHVYAGMAATNHVVGDPQTTLRLYKKAVAQMPRRQADAALHSNMGDLLHQLNRLPEAIDSYTKALRVDPRLAYAHSGLGDAYMKVGKPDEAIKHYREAVALNPHNAVMRYNLGVACQTRNRLDEALEQYRLAVAADPSLVSARSNLATLLLASGKLAEATVHLREVIRLDAKAVQAMNNLAWILATGRERSSRDVQEAVDLALKAVSLSKRQDPVVLGTLAEAYDAAGNPVLATLTATEALQLARAQGQDRVAAQVQRRLQRYQKLNGP